MKTAVIIVGYLFVLFSLIPLVRNDNWIFRIFEYPRFQKLIVNAIVLLTFVSLYGFGNNHDTVFVVVLCANLLYLLYQVYPYTAIAKNQMTRVSRILPERALSLLICNVYQDNRKIPLLLNQIKEYQPDIVLVVEVDHFWDAGLQEIHKDYPHRILNPLPNTYGMSLYSKLELTEDCVKFLVEKDIPSIRTQVKLRNGHTFTLFGLHPKPPVPQESARSTERDAEILIVAKAVEKMNTPVIVAGDLNDVAWSYTTELFLKISGLLDPRRGRGFFNTFHVKYPLMRWPLDHVFCSKHFALVQLKRLEDMGSDHFPMFISLQLAQEKEARQERQQMAKTAEDDAVAEEKIQKAS